ncbi:MAG: hypothetical protein CSA26_05035 [Desulfobacterales bacterium]|nr:MAG: hypothetical protein CSA26_05035 [Desulfobacterales bacterium]
MKPEKREPELQVMTWYNKEDWDQLKTLFSDGHLLPSSHESWLQMAEKAKKSAEEEGDIVVTVTIDTVLFPDWCHEHNRPTDAESRTAFAIETVKKQQFLNTV